MEEFISYGKQWIDESDIASVLKVLNSDFLTQGPAVEEFERSLCELTGARYCVSFSSATAALHVAVRVLDLPEGSEGITSPNTFVASANCLVYNALKPVFADIDPITYNLSPAETEKQITSKTKVLIPVHFAGQPADMFSFKRTADKHDLKIIEDAAHAIGSRYSDGKPVGCCSQSDMTVFSFHPVKTVTTGEGGAVTTNDSTLAKRLRLYRSHGIERSSSLMSESPGPWYYEMTDLGFNYRLTDLQASLGISQLKRLDVFHRRRREIVFQYNQSLGTISGIITPQEIGDVDSCFHLYVLKIDYGRFGVTRTEVIQALKEQGIGTQVHYIPVHTQPYYRQRWGYQKGDFPKAEAYYEQALSLPLYPKMTDNQVKQVIEGLRKVLRT